MAREGSGDGSPPDSRRPALVAAILTGLVAQVLVILWIAASEIPARVFISSWSVSMPGILIVAALLLASRCTSPAVRQKWLSYRAILLVYVMVAVSGIITGYGHIQVMVPSLGAVIWRAGSGTGWERFHPALPAWLVPHSRAVMKGMFTGEAGVPWREWLVPLACWFLFLALLYGAMLFLASILSRHWIHGERLTFPVAQLPLEMASPERGLFRNRAMWVGFVIPMVLESLVALNYYYPAVPAVEIKHRDWNAVWFPERPLSAMKPFYWGWTPFIIGFAYLAPLDVSFSVWFFNLAAKAERVYSAMAGLDTPNGGASGSVFPFPEEQALGAFIAFALAALWRSWPDIRRAWSAHGEHAEAADAATLRWSTLGLAVCTAGVILFLRAAGLAPWIGGSLLAMILLLAVTLSRIRAEAGPAWVFGPSRDPTRALVLLTGTKGFSMEQVTGLSLFRWISRDVRFLPMPFQMEALKIGDAAGIRKSRLLAVIALATAFGIAFGFYVVMRDSYALGWGSGKVYGGPIAAAASTWSQATEWIKNPLLPDRVGLPWILGGGLACLGLMGLRSLFVWWPFHPIGYVMAETGAGSSFWFHYMVAWTFKFAVLRYGGHRFYARTIPFVIGVILGDILTQTVWSAGAVLFNAPVYQFVS